MRMWTPTDIPALCDLTRQPGLNEFSVSGHENYSEERARLWIETEMQRYAERRLGKFAICLRESKELIGICGLFRMPPPEDETVELNYRYPIHRRGQGFALEAARAVLEYGFAELGLREIYANVAVENLASKKILERIGMTKVGDVVYAGISGERWKINKK